MQRIARSASLIVAWLALFCSCKPSTDSTLPPADTSAPLVDEPNLAVDSEPVQQALRIAASNSAHQLTTEGVAFDVLRRLGDDGRGLMQFDVRLRNRSGSTIYFSGSGDAFSGRAGDPTLPAFVGEVLDNKTAVWRDIGPGYCGNGLARAAISDGHEVIFRAFAQLIACDEGNWIWFILHVSEGLNYSSRLVSQPVRLRVL